MVDERLLKVLVCPKCKQDIRPVEGALACDTCCVKYPVREGIPIMLIDEAEPLEDADQR